MVSDWALQIEAERERNLDRLLKHVDFFEYVADNIERFESLDARVDMLESMFNAIKDRSFDDDSSDEHDTQVESINVKRGVAAYGLKMLGKTNREIAQILWPTEEYDENRHGTYIRRDVRQAKHMLIGLSSVLPPD